MTTVYVIVAFVVAGWIIYNREKSANETARKGSEHIVCPHCGYRGHVTGRSAVKAKGVSGGKAAGAVLTAGTSVLFTGLSRNRRVRELHCAKCNSTWHIDN